jgi:hypothetical protein
MIWVICVLELMFIATMTSVSASHYCFVSALYLAMDFALLYQICQSFQGKVENQQ